MGRIYGVFIVAGIVTVTVLIAALGYQLTVNAQLKANLQAAQVSNQLLSSALDRMVKQRSIDANAVASLSQKLRDLETAFDRQSEALRELANDPEAAEYLNGRVPDGVRCLFENATGC